MVVWSHSSADSSVADTTYFGIALSRSAIGPVWSRQARARPCQVSRASSSASAASARSSAPCRPASVMYGKSASAGGASMTPSSVTWVCAVIEVIRVNAGAHGHGRLPRSLGSVGAEFVVQHDGAAGGIVRDVRAHCLTVGGFHRRRVGRRIVEVRLEHAVIRRRALGGRDVDATRRNLTEALELLSDDEARLIAEDVGAPDDAIRLISSLRVD